MTGRPIKKKGLDDPVSSFMREGMSNAKEQWNDPLALQNANLMALTPQSIALT